MTIDVKINIENATVTVTVGGQTLQATSAAGTAGTLTGQKNLGASPQAASDPHQVPPDPGDAPADPGSSPQQVPTDPGSAPGSRAVVIVPIVIIGGAAGQSANLVAKPVTISPSATK